MTDKIKDFGIEPIEPPSQSKGKGKAKGEGKSKPKDRPTDLTITQLEAALANQFNIMGTLLSGFDTYDGGVIIDKADDLAEKLTDLARTHKGVRNFLEKLVATGTYSAIIALIGGEIMMPIAVHHQWLPEPINELIAVSQDIPLKEKKGKNNADSNDQEIFGIGLVPDDGRNEKADEQGASRKVTDSPQA